MKVSTHSIRLSQYGISLPVDITLDVPESTIISRYIWGELISGRYERNEMLATLGAILDNDVVLEIGSGLGFLSAIICKLHNVKWIGVEADVRLVDYGKRLHSQNQIVGACFLNRVVVGTRDSREHLFFIRENFWANSLRPEHREVHRVISTPAIELRALLRRVKPSVVVCDVEGYETEIFDRCSLSSVRVLVVELHENKTTKLDLASFLRDLKRKGFSLVRDSSGRVLTAIRECQLN